jgi:RNA polymerase sigma-70 factor (ECF subfamily)
MGGLGTIVYQANLTGSPEPVPSSETDSGLSLMPDVDRFRRAQSGCPDAFAALVDEYGPRILHYLRRWTGNEHDAEDLTQETFLKAYRGLARCSHVRALNGWLFTIARRTALNFQRARQCRPWPVQELSQELEEPRDLESDAGDRLWEMARALPHEYFEVLWLRYGEDLSVSEVARVLGISGLNVRVRLHRARRQLRGQLTAGRALGQESEARPKQAVKSNEI